MFSSFLHNWMKEGDCLWGSPNTRHMPLQVWVTNDIQSINQSSSSEFSTNFKMKAASARASSADGVSMGSQPEEPRRKIQPTRSYHCRTSKANKNINAYNPRRGPYPQARGNQELLYWARALNSLGKVI